MATFESGMTITICGDGNEIFVHHTLGPDEATFVIQSLRGQEAVDANDLDLDRIGDVGAEELLDDIFAASLNVINAAKEDSRY